MPNKITRELKVKIKFETSRNNDELFAKAYEELIALSKQKIVRDKFNSSVFYQKEEIQK